MTDEEQRQRFLENEIHKTSLKMMESDMVKKKYQIIHDMLKKVRERAAMPSKCNKKT